MLLAFGAYLYFALPSEPSLLFLAAASLLCGASILILRASRFAGMAATAAFIILLGALLGKAETLRAATQMLGGEISTRITGRVVSLDVLASGRARLTIDIVKTERPTLKYAPQRVRVTARKATSGLRAGDLVSGLVKLRPPSGPVRPDSYDFSFESYFDGIGASGFFMTGPDMVEGKPPERGSIAAAIQNIRDRIASRIRARIGGPEGEIAAALLVGVRAGIPGDISEALRRTGIYHIISISGLHMALVAGAVIGAIRAGFALFPGFASRRPVRKYAAFAGLLAIAGYLVISGGEVAAQRSFLMLAVMLLALMFDRAALTMRNLAISAIVVLVIAPHEVMGPSFQMSYAATAALVGAYGLWSERRAANLASPPEPSGTVAGRALRRTAGIVSGLLVTSLVAGLATSAYGAYHFQRISPLSLPANLAVMPVVSGIVTPAAVLAAIAMPFGLDGFFLDIMGKGIAAMVAVAEWMSARSPVDAVGLISGYAVIALTAALIVATVATTWLRLLAIPVAVAGCAMLGAAREPDILIAEDARLVAFRTADGRLALNQPRGDGFTAESWMRALATNDLARPGSEKAVARPFVGFVCSPSVCKATVPGKAVVVRTADEEDARQACATASVIVVADATSRLRCARSDVAIVTLRQLARSGSAAVYLPASGRGKPEVEFAIGEPDRPWHASRVFSREARGMRAYAPKAKGESKPIDAVRDPQPAG